MSSKRVPHNTQAIQNNYFSPQRNRDNSHLIKRSFQAASFQEGIFLFENLKLHFLQKN
jgi:hypothetical protein